MEMGCLSYCLRDSVVAAVVKDDSFFIICFNLLLLKPLLK